LEHLSLHQELLAAFTPRAIQVFEADHCCQVPFYFRNLQIEAIPPSPRFFFPSHA
jgi:hypothetical protein